MMAENHILLLPRVNFFKWVRAVQKYANHFGVVVTQDSSKIGTKHTVTVVIAENGYPREGNIVEWIRLRFPEIMIDPLIVQNPEELEAVLDNRIESEKRFGSLSGIKDEKLHSQKYPQNRLYLFWPTDYPKILQNFGDNPEIYGQFDLPGHDGIDIRAAFNSNVYACAEGEVALIKERDSDSPLGGQIEIKHNNGYRTLYTHLDQTLVSIGDKVKARELIGRINTKAKSTNQPLHLSLKKDEATAKGLSNFPGDIIDPTPFLVFISKEAEVMKAIGMNGSAKSLRSYPWTRPCLVGLSSRISGSMQEVDFSVIEEAHIEAVLIRPKTTTMTIKRLKELVPDMFYLARLSVPFGKARMLPKEWLESTRVEIERLYKLGVRYFEIQQSPNLLQYGWRVSWVSGEGFGQWWTAIAERLWVEFPEIKLGFPGVCPGGHVPGKRLDSNVFLDGADAAMSRADWIGVNCYWSDENSMDSIEKGRFYEVIREWYPNKLLFITEFANINPNTQSRNKGYEYVEFYQRLRNMDGIGAAFAQVVSASNGYNALVWRTEKGELNSVVDVVSKRGF